MHLTIKFKLILIISILIASISAFIFIYFPALYEKSEIKSTKEKAEIINKMIAYNLSPAIYFNDSYAVDEVVIGAKQNKDILYVVIEDQNDDIIFESADSAGYVMGYKDITNRLFNNSKSVYRTKELIYHNEEMIGKLYIGYSVTPVYIQIQKARNLIAQISIIIFFVGAVSIYFISNYSLKSLTHINKVAESVSSGNRNIRAQLTRDETGTLANTFNLMLDKLEHSRKNLEQIVQERTADLQKEIEMHKETEKELIEARNNAEEMNRLKTIFLTNMSHELRTPLNGILGFAQYLHDSDFNDEIRDLASKIHMSGRRLLNTLNSILDLASIEGKAFKADIKPTDIVKETEETLALLEPLALNKKIYLKFDKTSPQILAMVDPHLYYQVLNNLVGNAVKFTETGGVTVMLDDISSNGNGQVKVKVIDTGIGIPEKYHSLIFQAFRQVSEGLSRKFEGSGLGLSIAKNFVVLMKGKIELNSRPGEGAEFTITFNKAYE